MSEIGLLEITFEENEENEKDRRGSVSFVTVDGIKINFTRQQKIYKKMISDILKGLEKVSAIGVKEDNIKKLVGYPEDYFYSMQSIREVIRGTGLSVRAMNDKQINDGKRTFIFYNTKIRFGICEQ